MKERKRENRRSCCYLVYWPIDVLDYLMEGLRGIILDPLGVLLGRSFRYLKGLRYPKQLEERKRLQLAKHPSSSQYCMFSQQLSFFDPFSCLNGVPTHFLILPNVESSREDATSSDEVRAAKLETKSAKDIKQRVKQDSAFQAPSSEAISVCCFSSDGSKFAICYESGDVTIWDSYHGSLWSKTQIEDPPATNVSFHENENSVLLILTKAYTCWKWDISSNSPTLAKICDHERLSTEMEEILNGVIISQRLDFCMDGTKLVFSTIANIKDTPTLGVVLVSISSNPFKVELRQLHSVEVERNYLISNASLAPNGKRLLMSLVDHTFEDSYCLLWPNYDVDPTIYKEFDKVTVGSWSNDSKHVVTWIMTNKPNLTLDDKSSSFIWNVEEMCENPVHFECTFKAKKLSNPFGDNVFWCQLTKDMDENDRLIMCICGQFTRFLFWDVKTCTHTHTIETKISSKDMMSRNQEAWIASCVEQKSVKGLNPIGLTKDESIFGAVLGHPSEILIWDVHQGVEVLRICKQISLKVESTL